jgi:hypothetical protein
MRFIGTVVRLHVQEVSLKVGQAPRRRYDPTGIRTVALLELDDGGVRGYTDNGDAVADVHHRNHPASKNRDGENGVSLGFTSHYAAMRDRFGDHLVDGIAGENILVQTDHLIYESALSDGIVIITDNGQEPHLESIIPAAPCVEFSRYALRFPDDARPDESVTEALRFLNDGIRGYYAIYRGPAVRIALGNRVYAQ